VQEFRSQRAVVSVSFQLSEESNECLADRIPENVGAFLVKRSR
jgi:hypothetical protein